MSQTAIHTLQTLSFFSTLPYHSVTIILSHDAHLVPPVPLKFDRRAGLTLPRQAAWTAESQVFPGEIGNRIHPRLAKGAPQLNNPPLAFCSAKIGGETLSPIAAGPA